MKARPVRSATERARACHRMPLRYACSDDAPEKSSSPRSLTTTTPPRSWTDSSASGAASSRSTGITRVPGGWAVHSAASPPGTATPALESGNRWRIDDVICHLSLPDALGAAEVQSGGSRDLAYTVARRVRLSQPGGYARFAGTARATAAETKRHLFSQRVAPVVLESAPRLTLLRQVSAGCGPMSRWRRDPTPRQALTALAQASAARRR